MASPSSKPPAKKSTSASADTPAGYDSALMHSRRQRILAETRRVIEEHGIENLSMRELCKHADVAQRTLYNAFGSKDHIVALAIQDHYFALIQRMKFDSPPDTIDGVIDRMMRVTLRGGTRHKNYLKAILAVYFSPVAHPDIVNVTREISAGNVMPWLLRLQQLKQINPVLPLDTVASDMSDLVFTIMRRWTVGEISNAQMAAHVVRSFLVLAVGATVGEAQVDAMRRLALREATGTPRVRVKRAKVD